MDDKLLRRIRKIATLRHTLLLALLVLMMSFFIMPEASKQIKQYSGGTGLLDKQLYYSPEEAYEMMTAYGPRGRNLYIVVELTADLVLSICRAAFLSSLLIWSSARLRRRSISVLPLMAMIFDWLENSGIIWMLYHFPEPYYILSIATSLFTFSKWILIVLCIALAVWNLLMLANIRYHFFQGRRHGNAVAENNWRHPF